MPVHREERSRNQRGKELRGLSQDERYRGEGDCRARRCKERQVGRLHWLPLPELYIQDEACGSSEALGNEGNPGKGNRYQEDGEELVNPDSWGAFAAPHCAIV